MADGQMDYGGQMAGDPNLKVREIEERQRMLKDRVLMLSQNLIDLKDNTNLKLLELKKNVEKMSQDVTKLVSFMETLSGELSKYAKREDLEILMKQAKMFQPLDFATKKDLEKLKKQKG